VQEFKQTNLVKLHTINPDEPLRLGHFLCRFFRVSHSIPDAVGVVIETPVGKIVHTGDFKFDESPARNQIKPDIRKIEELGNQNILALFCESTNSLKEGHSMPEQEVGRVLGEVIKEAPGRVIVASFSSQIGRMQQILDAAENDQRKVFVSGRSMRTNLDIAGKLGYLKYKQDQVRDVKKYKNDPDKETLILTTGSQGEPISALTRMASGEHPHVKIKKGDTVILSSSPIIGNERAIYNVINNLASLGAEVIHNQIADVHTSGHGKREEIKKMINLVKPKYLIPIHGEYFMRQELGRMANKSCNIPSERVLMIGNGDVLIGEKGKIYKSNEKVEAKYILIDGSGEGTLDSQVQYDRSMMSQNGALLILVHIDKKSKRLKKTPDVVSRGFIYMHESEEITEEIAEVAGKAYQSINEKNKGANRKDIKQYIKQFVDKYAQKKLNRKPLIIPLIIES
jgi:ribonuclease J